MFADNLWEYKNTVSILIYLFYIFIFSQ